KKYRFPRHEPGHREFDEPVDGDDLIQTEAVSPGEEEDAVFTFAEVMPEFPGGDTAFKNYLLKNIRYAQERHTKEGSVYVSFIVETDGSITAVKVLKGIPGASPLNNEAVRVISAMPRWNPGRTNGQVVRVSMVQQVRFVLQY
ncbi:MAG TPA: TonB family protein, partial [Bacteroidia bacterium]|nr:TonB family protein [Bacteroidia bacterium]